MPSFNLLAAIFQFAIIVCLLRDKQCGFRVSVIPFPRKQYDGLGAYLVETDLLGFP